VGEVAQGQGDGVGGVDRPERSGDAEQRLHHALHLLLVGAAEAGDGLLDLVGRVLDDLGARRHALDHRETGGLGDRDRGAGVDLEQHPFDGHDLRTMLGDEPVQVVAQQRQAVGNAESGIGAQHTGRHRPGAATGALDHAVAAARQAGIDAEHEHGFGR
jgi:hypothetical protein